MIRHQTIDRFLARGKGQALSAGTRYAQEARVSDFAGSPGGAVPQPIPPLRGTPRRKAMRTGKKTPGRKMARAASKSLVPARHDLDIARLGVRNDTDPEEARRRAVQERKVAARREKLRVRPDVAPFLEVCSASGFSYRIHLRGDGDGPHACDCPDFEANRLHTCKHVERARIFLKAPRTRLPRKYRRAARKPRVYLFFGETVEPRLLGRPVGRGAPRVRNAFAEDGLPLLPPACEEAELRRWLGGFGGWVEPEALAWLDRRLAAQPVLPKGKFARLLPPLGLTPYRYQWTGAAFLAGAGRALLADEMGLGKTVQAILAAVALRRAARPVRRVTVVCPASLRGGWQDELRMWIGEEATLLEGRAPDRHKTIASGPAWLITHYEQVLRDHSHHAAHPPDLLIVDEAQRAKGLRTRTARVLKAIGARHVFALTGTPLENRLEEAYAIAQLIDQRLLPPLWQIDRDHFVRDDKGRRVVLYRGLDALRSRLAPAFLRRRKEDVALDLPERLRSTVMVPMHPAVESTYGDVLAQVARIAGKKVLLPADLERMQRLLVIARRCCNGPHMLGLDVDARKVPKLQELEEALRELCLGEKRKAVVFSEWTDMTDRVESLSQRLGLSTFYLHGGVPVRRRPALIRAFTELDGPAVFVSTDAGGLGLNLQAADVVINLDLPWNPARLEQRIARIHRIGSRGTVQELLLVTRDSIEERILALHSTKRNVLDNIWAADGEDVIAAPGGSGGFQEMVAALLRAHAPAPAKPGEARPGEAEKTAAVGPSPSTDAPAAPKPAGSVAHGKTAPGEPSGAPTLAPGPVTPSPGTTLAIDPLALTAAVTAVASTLPPDHRRSLATVFRALAESLEA